MLFKLNTMENKNFNALEVIEEMIEKTKNQYSDNGYLYLIWGWLVFAAAIIHYILKEYSQFDYPFISWAILMPIGGLLSMIYANKNQQKVYVKTYTDDIMKYTWLAFAFTMVSILFNMPKLQLNTYPLLMIAYAVPTFISGGVFKFKPLIWGAIASLALGLISFHISFDKQLLSLAAAILFAYIIPGYILKSRYKS